MKKVALVFVVAVLAPSLVLAWLALRSLRDQQFLLERQQALLDQHVTDTLAQNIASFLAQRQREFSTQVESLATRTDPQTLAVQFDDLLRQRWPLAEVGFCVTAAGKILSPKPNARPEAQMFRLDNSSFLGNRKPVEVYLTPNNAGGGGGNGLNNSPAFTRSRPLLAASESAAPTADSGPESSARAAAVPPAVSPPPASAPAVSSPPASHRNASPSAKGASNAFVRKSPAPAPRVQQFASARSDSISAQQKPSGPDANSRPAMHGAANTQQAFALEGYTANNIAGSPPQRTSAAANGPARTGGSAGSVPPAGLGGRSQFEGPAAIPAAPEPAEPPDFGALDRTAVAVVVPAGKDDQPAPPAPEEPAASQNTLNYKTAETRKVNPQSQIYENTEKSKAEAAEAANNLSKVVPAEAEFRQLIGDQTDGMLARFLQNQLKLMCWHRLGTAPELIFGAQLNLDRVVDGLRGLMRADAAPGQELCLAILDDNAKPVVLSRDRFQANWKRPFVATEIGEALPHWEVAAYLVNPAQLSQTAQTTKLTLGLLIAVLVIAIGIGSLLIVRGLEVELKLARQKTDFVSNVSHELKTPLTSIRMFSELLAEGRVADKARQHSYLQIISAEAGRLTRLINNVLDFSRMERGEKKYNFQPCDLTEIVRAAAETFRPHLEEAGFRFAVELPPSPLPARGDADALSQVIVNLLSNAEKYSNGGREILLALAPKQAPLPHAEIRVADRGAGVPRGSEEKIFEKFYRAHDSLSSGIQGSGLGLTIARQIARAHGGDVTHEPREGGGSCFIVRLPLQNN